MYITKEEAEGLQIMAHALSFEENTHIFHVSTAQSWRGGEQQLVYLYEALNHLQNERGHVVKQTIVCSTNSELSKHCRLTAKNYIALQKRNSFDLSFAWHLKKVCSHAKEKNKIIHVHDSHAHTIAVLSSLIFNNSLPIVVSRRVDFEIGKSFLSAFKYNYKGVKKIICVSNAIKNIISPRIKDKSKLLTIYDGTYRNTPLFKEKYKNSTVDKGKLRREFHVPDDYFLIGNVAALAPHKDYFTFIDTAKILIEEGIKAKFFIIGEGNEREKITKYIQLHNMQHHIIMTGFRSDIAELLPGLDLFLMTSETEGLGSSILDAMGCDIPVVATCAGGIPEIVKHNETGLLAPVKNSVLLAENVVTILSNQNLKDTLVKKASENLIKFYVGNMARETMMVYREASLEELVKGLHNKNKH